MASDAKETKTPRGRPRVYPPEFDQAVDDAAASGASVTDIHRELQSVSRRLGLGSGPSRKWVERRMPRQEVDLWSLDDLSGEESRRVLDFLAWLAAGSAGSITALSKQQAHWIVRIQEVAPDLDNYTLWRFVLAYIQRLERKEPTFDLHLWLAMKPWTPEGEESYRKARAERWLPTLPSWIVSRRPTGMTLQDLDWRLKMNRLAAEVREQIRGKSTEEDDGS